MTKKVAKRVTKRPTYIYFVTKRGKDKLKRLGAEPGSLRYLLSPSARALWALSQKGISGGTARYLSAWVERKTENVFPTSTEGTPHRKTTRTLDTLVAKGLARRRRLHV